jgi:5-methylcytosine-specific restriction endonuclease McrA
MKSFRSASATATLDHVIPLSKGGPNKRENIVLACGKCNRDKGDKLNYAGPQS